MSSPFLAEIKMFAGNFAPHGYALCDGQILSIAQNAALFSLIGTFYGGNGVSNFGLPNFQGNVAIGQGNGAGLTPRVLGETSGSQTVTLNVSQMAAHTHTIVADGANGRVNAPANDTPGHSPVKVYVSGVPNVTMNPSSLTMAGQTGPHNNLQPYLAINFIIAMLGVFPARN